ncbi:MAG: Eco57I restriction-modification methylase domain-containing protein [Methanobacterium formicicum]
MDHKNAVALLEETFEHEFDIDRFANFIKELFNHFKVSIHDVPLWKEYYDYVDSVNSLGVYRDSDKRSIEVFTIKLKRTSSRDRARTMQRNLIARYLTKFNLDAALVAFYGDDPDDWRFSFVKMEYELTKDEKGNLKVTEELTPARRYSFLVGKNEPNHTCKLQFLGLIKEETTDPLLTQIDETFSIENVTKEFFSEYKELYLKLKESLEKSIENDEVILQEFENKVIKTSDFAKKLMGQIVFIYFLQKKGWLGVGKGKKWGTGPKKFLRKLFNGEIVEYNNFFNDVLEHLFYDALSSKHDEDYYDKFECKIPFLNGGLFEPINDYDWKKTDIQLNNDIFKEILDTFDLYNFTVKEDEPLEKEVAVDPEMLGKVFENLLEIEDRKSKGAFYTPREIVHYICQESLISYLNTNSNIIREDIENLIRLGDVALGSIIKEQEQIKKYKKSFIKPVLPSSIKDNHAELDKLLCDIKIVDPAVGSGAFPVGMMNEIIRARTILSLYSGKNVTNYELKLETIENCLYGVDIESSAVDITKLRFWLSLIVDEEDVTTIDPLPNLDHKIMCGNSLLDEFKGIKLFNDILLTESPKDTTTQSTLNKDFNIRLKRSQVKINELRKLQKDFFNEQNPQNKEKLREDINRIEWDLIEETLKEDGNDEAIEKLAEYKKTKSKPFFIWKLYFSEIFQRDKPGFDVVIANPPYIRVQKLNKNERGLYKQKYESAVGSYDIYILFIEKSIDLLRKDGNFAFIMPTKFFQATYGKNIRKIIHENTNINHIIDFGTAQVFSEATTYACLFFFTKTNIKSEFFKLIKIKENPKIIENFSNIYNIDDEFNDDYEIFNVKQNVLNQKQWNFLPPKLMKIVTKLERMPHKLSDLNTNIFQGITTGADPIFYVKIKNNITNDIVEIENSNGNIFEIEKEVLHPLLKGKNIRRFYTDFANLYIIFLYEINNNKAFLYSQQYLEKNLPKTWNYLKMHEDKLKGREKGKWKNRSDWYDHSYRKNLEKFENTKILTQVLANQSSFTWDKNGQYYFVGGGNAGGYGILLNDVLKGNNEKYKYVLALLNSKLLDFHLKAISSKFRGGYFSYAKRFIEQLPIYLASPEEQLPFVKISERLLELYEMQYNKKDVKDEIKQLETELDYAVYELYGLTDEEVKIVEENTKI